MPEDQDKQTWGVSVEDVLALAPHVRVVSESDTPQRDPQYGGAADTSTVTRTAVEEWITDVARAVDVRISRYRRITGENLARLHKAAATVTKVGAGAYLVDAAHPTRAGVGDNASYGNVLWTRYQDLLEELEKAAEDMDGQPDDPGHGVYPQIRHTFPKTSFPDDLNSRW